MSAFAWVLAIGVVAMVATLAVVPFAFRRRHIAMIGPAAIVVVIVAAVVYALVPAISLLARPLELIDDEFIPIAMAVVFVPLLATGLAVAGKLLPLKGSDVPPAARRKEPEAPRGGAPDVFISYKRDERSEVVAIAGRLEALKLRVWFDAQMQSGTTFDSEIHKQVLAARAVLVCWSPGAAQSEWVRSEATIGQKRGVLAAAMLKPCDLPPPFNIVHADDLTTGIGPGNPEWLRVVERIGMLAGRPGLAAFEALELGRDKSAYAAWIAANSGDPLLDVAVSRLKAIPA
jgi:TIR domain